MINIKKYLLLLVTSFLFVNTVVAQNTDIEDIPTYKDGILKIPRVDTAGQAGAFKDVEFVYDQELKAWHLTSAVEQVKAPVNEVLLLAVTDSFPVNVLLQVSGEFTGCGKVGEIDQRFQDNRFEIQIYGVYPEEDMECDLPVSPYQKVILVPTFGLQAGDYEYSVNGVYSGTFNLRVNNSLAECEGAACLQTTTRF